MNRSFSKIRHIQESNLRMEQRFLSEQFHDELTGRKSEFDVDDELENYIRHTKKTQIQTIIDNFESINCEDYNEMMGDFLDVPEHVSIYCQAYPNKTKEEMIHILDNL